LAGARGRICPAAPAGAETIARGASIAILDTELATPARSWRHAIERARGVRGGVRRARRLDGDGPEEIAAAIVIGRELDYRPVAADGAAPAAALIAEML
jgi:hypothetical protein